MKTTARVALAIVVLLVGALVLPRPAGRVFTSDALAQVPLPTPTLPDVLPSPTPTPTEDPPPGDGGGGGGGGGGDDGDGGGGGGIIPGGDDDGGGGGGDGGNNGGRGGGGRGGNGARGKRSGGSPVQGFYRVPGSYNTEALVAVAARLRSLGWSSERVLKKVFAPFIIGGRANWVDTWGAPRFGPGPIVRTHEGQDVFCEYGDPVLASEDGTVEYGDGGLGGKVARLRSGDGSYWYYAHLSDWNTQRFASGDTVETGDVIGYCGNTGNALTTPPHVHFGWYQGGSEAKNPMRVLVRWLREAERRAGVLTSRAEDKRLRQIVALTSARRFGDAFSPDLSELEVSSESLWAAGSSPAASALSLAESALQAALAGSEFGSGALQSSAVGAGDSDQSRDVAMDPAAQLARFFGEGEDATFGEQAD